MKPKRNSLKSRLAPLLLGLAFLSGCAGATSDTPCASCPPWPKAGAPVAEELLRIDPADFPHTVEWMQRLEKLRDQLEAGRASHE